MTTNTTNTNLSSGYEEGWTEDDWLSANAEGWNIWFCDGSDNGLWQICRYDDPEGVQADCPEWGVIDGGFTEDADAWLQVWRRAAGGSSLHQRALDYVKAHNPPEWHAIIKWVDSRDTAE